MAARVQHGQAAQALSTELLNGANYIQEIDLSLIEVQNALDQNPMLDPDLRQNLAYLSEKIDPLFPIPPRWALSPSVQRLKGIDESVRDELNAQCQRLKDQAHRLKNRAVTVFKTFVERERGEIDTLCGQLKQKVAEYLQSRNGKALLESREMEEGIPRRCYFFIDLTNRLCIWEGRFDYLCYRREFSDFNHLRRIIYPSESVTAAFFGLDLAIAKEMGSPGLEINWQNFFSQVDEAVEMLGSERVDALMAQADGISEIEFKRIHRYDDLGRLRAALKTAAEEFTAKMLSNCAQGLNYEEICDALYQWIGSPPVANPKEWMKENLYYYVFDLKEAIDNVFFGLHRDVDFQSTSSSSTSSSSPRPLEITQHSHALRALEWHVKMNDPIDEDTRRDQIEPIIEEIHEDCKRSIVDEYVERLSTGSYTEGSRWGALHRYDDLAILHRALMKASSDRFRETYLVSLLPSEEQQNLYYKEISALSRIEHGQDPIAWGRENIAYFYHLMMLVESRILSASS